MNAAGIYGQCSLILENLCGDPNDPQHPLSWAAAISRDEDERFPIEALAYLEEAGLSRLQVPQSQGGCLQSFEELFSLSRSLARRDPALALSFAMKTWSQLIWMAGTPTQKAWAAELLLKRQGYFCLAVSEAAHGADLLASDVTSRVRSDGFELDGEKWPIGMAIRAEAALVLARMEGVNGYRSLSWYLIDRQQFSAAQVQPLAKLKTLGLRSAELAGLQLKGVHLTQADLIGQVGDGLELTLKLFQVTRTLLPGLALGVSDTALRIGTAFVCQRVLYKKSVSSIPLIQERLIGAYLDHLAAEILMLSSIRGGMHLCPHELSVVSLMTKVFVPKLTGRVLEATFDILGARGYLREGLAAGIFQKMLRDHQAIQLIDGSSSVCLSALATQIPALSLGPAQTATVTQAGYAERLKHRFCLESSLPTFDPSCLELLARGCDDVCQGFATRSFKPADGPSTPWLESLFCEWHHRYADLQQQANLLLPKSVQVIALAQEYCILHAAAACIFFHIMNPSSCFNDLFLAGTLCRLLRPSHFLSSELSIEVVEHVLRQLKSASDEPALFSVFPFPLKGQQQIQI